MIDLKSKVKFQEGVLKFFALFEAKIKILLEFVPVRRMDSPVLLNEYRWLEYSYPNDNFRHWALLFLQVSRRLKYQIEYIPFNSNCLSITINQVY